MKHRHTWQDKYTLRMGRLGKVRAYQCTGENWGGCWAEKLVPMETHRRYQRTLMHRKEATS